MVNLINFRKTALSYPETSEASHFEKISFRVKNKIFATYDAANKRATLKLSQADQYVYSAATPGIIYAVPNKWGKQGWTIVELQKIKMELFKEALQSAYCEVAPAKLAVPFRKESST